MECSLLHRDERVLRKVPFGAAETREGSGRGTLATNLLCHPYVFMYKTR